MGEPDRNASKNISVQIGHRCAHSLIGDPSDYLILLEVVVEKQRVEYGFTETESQAACATHPSGLFPPDEGLASNVTPTPINNIAST
jgi:hypothetical protein